MRVSMSFRVFFFSTVLMGLVVSTVSAQRQKTFTGATDVIVVEVPVTVVHDGEPLRGLTKESFQIQDSGKTQEILSFELVDLQQENIARNEIPIAARRHFLLLFDMSFSRPEALVRARWAARDLIDQLHPSDLAGVAIYTASQGADFILGFTSDRRQLELAVASLGSPRLINRNADPLGLLVGDLQPNVPQDFFSRNAVVDSTNADGVSEAREAAAGALEEGLQQDIARLANAETTDIRRRVQAMSRNLADMAGVLGKIDGRKHVVYLSEGFPEEVLIGRGRDDQSAASVASGEIWDVQGDDAFGDTGLQNEYEKMIEEFRRAGCSVHAIDIAGLRAANRSESGLTALTAFSQGTGGELFRNINDLGQAMDKMLQRTSVTYLLTFQPSKLKADGKYRKLKVKLLNAPRGARLSHRAGYYAPDPDEEVGDRERQLTTAEKFFSDSPGDFDTTILGTAFPVAGEKPYVPVLIEVDGDGLLADQEISGPMTLELFAYAIGQDGAVLDYFAQSLNLDLDQIGGALQQSGFKYWGHFDLPPGEHTARIMIKHGDRFANARKTIRVPEFEQGGATLLPPIFPEAPGSWVMAREGADRQRAVDYPFMVDGNAVIPSCRPTVKKKGKVPFHIQGLNLAGDVDLVFEVRDMDGSAVDKASVQVANAAPTNGRLSVPAELQTKGLATGIYTLTATATDANGESITSSLPFAVQ